MATWEGRAIDLFPDAWAEVQRQSHDPQDLNIYQLYFVLLPMVGTAHRTGDDELLRRIYGFADWCRVQPEEDLWNAAGVAFYEHLFDEWSGREAVVPWLSPGVVEDAWTLWEARLAPEQLTELRRLFDQREVHRWRECAV